MTDGWSLLVAHCMVELPYRYSTGGGLFIRSPAALAAGRADDGAQGRARRAARAGDARARVSAIRVVYGFTFITIGLVTDGGQSLNRDPAGAPRGGARGCCGCVQY